MNGSMGGGASGLQPAPNSPLQPPAPPTLNELQKRKRVASEEDQLVDCYPYAFSPLLLFAPAAYFDRGYSNYHAVAQFFSGVLEVDMLSNVLADRKNMLYEELLDHVQAHQMLVTCCIDAHFTAFQCLERGAVIAYDPARGGQQLLTGDGAQTHILWHLLKCGYGNSQHVQENPEDHYTSYQATHVRKKIFRIYRDLNRRYGRGNEGFSKAVRLDLKDWYLVNTAKEPSMMASQLTGNTCYFQTFLFALLCRAGGPLTVDGSSLRVPDPARLERCSVAVARFLLEFWKGKDGCLRPLTNANVLLDFSRHTSAPYYDLCVKYLKKYSVETDYAKQKDEVYTYLKRTRVLHRYGNFSLVGAVASAPNTKSLQRIGHANDDAVCQLAKAHFYKYRATSLAFGFHAQIVHRLRDFAGFHALRKNQLLDHYADLEPILSSILDAPALKRGKHRDYYFFAQYENGQKELRDVHYYLYAVDLLALLRRDRCPDRDLETRCRAANHILAAHARFSTSHQSDYEQLVDAKDFARSPHREAFEASFPSHAFFAEYVALGFPDENPKEKDINTLTRAAFYTTKLMHRTSGRMEYEFEREAINQMARNGLRKYQHTLGSIPSAKTSTKVHLRIGMGFAWSKYNRPFHFLSVVEAYWRNPDLTGLQLFGKDVRSLLAISCQKLFDDASHTAYAYGPVEVNARGDLDLAVAADGKDLAPGVTSSPGLSASVIAVDRVFERHYVRRALEGLFARVEGEIRTDDDVINLALLSLLLDFGLFERYASALRLPSLPAASRGDTRQLQVEVSDQIHERDKKTSQDGVTRLKVEDLLFECAHKFLVNRRIDQRNRMNTITRALQADPKYRDYVLLVKIYVSLCQINKSAEVDSYKLKVDGAFRIVVPRQFSASTADYLDLITRRHTFTESNGLIKYDELPLFDVSSQNADVQLYKVRVDPKRPGVESVVRYVEISNVFRCSNDDSKYLLFVSDSALRVDASEDGVSVRVNQTGVELACAFFNDAVSFVPCFTYADSADAVLLASKNVKYHVDGGGQHHVDYYGMKHEVVECIDSDECFIDLNDEHAFQTSHLNELVTESKVTFYAPEYVLQVTGRQHLINLLDLAAHLRNASLFILVLFQLRRCSVKLDYTFTAGKVVKIAGPWQEAIRYVLGSASNTEYDLLFAKEFHDVDAHEHDPLAVFVDALCAVFVKFQRESEGKRQIVPRPKQRLFLKKIIEAPECFHFSEVGSGKTKVILPLFCMAFLSNNRETLKALARGGREKRCLVVLVPEHLVPDAKAQVHRYCLGLNFRQDYRIYDDIFALLHDDVRLDSSSPLRRTSSYSRSLTPVQQLPPRKQIFVTSFNQFKKALTYDAICKKVYPNRDRVLVLVDEVDDFLDRDKLVFNICQNKANNFSRETLTKYLETARSAYSDTAPAVDEDYWSTLHKKFRCIHKEVQDASRSLNKSFGIFNEATLRHCSSNISQDLDGYRSLIARPYESVNRAMPGSYYSDVERTIYLTYYVLLEDVQKYDALFKEERKFLSFEYYSKYLRKSGVEYDDLVYGHESLSHIIRDHPLTKDGLTRFLYEIVLKRMEIRDRARSVNSVDVVFNFDCVGFTGTPFIDNYPTSSYIRKGTTTRIPDLIDRGFYAHGVEALQEREFEARFRQFQGSNSNVTVRYALSDFVEQGNELDVLKSVLREDAMSDEDHVVPNVLVDLCGVFKRSSVRDVRDVLVQECGERFRYVYHVDPTDGGDRILCCKTSTDLPFDEEFYKFLVNEYGSSLPDVVFFFVDNRNVIGKDVPFQLQFREKFGRPLFAESVVLAHDVDDFSKIWQALGRSRTMSATTFTIYLSGYSMEYGKEAADVCSWRLTRDLYIKNCDMRTAGNLSSIYQTLVAVSNLSRKQFYHEGDIVNDFLERMAGCLPQKVDELAQKFNRDVFGDEVCASIVSNILKSKFSVATDASVRAVDPSPSVVQRLLVELSRAKHEVRINSNDVFDPVVAFLSGDANDEGQEISYTKQQQKTKQKQQNKNRDSDTMEAWDRKHQMPLSFEESDYYASCRSGDKVAQCLHLPIPKACFRLSYTSLGKRRTVRVFPTVQFVYSHHIKPEYVDDACRSAVTAGRKADVRSWFWHCVGDAEDEDDAGAMNVCVETNLLRQNPQYSLCAVRKGVYVIGTKDQFNGFEVAQAPLGADTRYVVDEAGFILYDADPSAKRELDGFGPYGVEQSVLADALSKREVAQNVLDYYVDRKRDLQRCLDNYSGAAGAGFVCWRFVMMDASRARCLSGSGDGDVTMEADARASQDFMAPD